MPLEIVVVPTYNEREMLPLFLEEFARAGGECLIVDDSSPDGTGELADDLDATGPGSMCSTAPARKGWEPRTGPGSRGRSSAATSGSARWTATSRILRERSRRCGRRPTAAPVSYWGHASGRWRNERLAARASHHLAGRLYDGDARAPPPYPDLTGGFKLWTADTLRLIDVSTTVSNGYIFQVESTRRAHIAGVRIEQVPFVFAERLHGASKMSPGIAREGARILWKLRRDGWRPPGRIPAPAGAKRSVTSR